MENEIPKTPVPESPVEAQPQIETQAGIEPQPHPKGPQLVAPVWHTIIIVAFILFSSWLSSKLGGTRGPERRRILLYISTMIQDVVLLAFIWFGLWWKQVKMRDLIGGRWHQFEDFLIDVALAAGFWVSSIGILFVLQRVVSKITATSVPSIDSARETIGAIMPKSGQELVVFISLALLVGFFEEVLFRGYLQKQLSALTGSAFAGLIIAGALFGAAHGYQGARMMVVLAVYGIMFGLLAHFRKNLRPGMMVHAWQDSIAGLAFFILTKCKLI